MAGTITRGNIPRLLQEGLKSVFGMAYDEHKVEYTQIVDEDNSSKAFEVDVQLEGFAPATQKSEGAGVVLDDMRQGFTPKYNHLTFARGFIATEEAIEDELYGVLKKKARLLAFSMRQAQELSAANLLNRGFNSAYTMVDGDGKPLFATDHLRGPSGGTFSNQLAVGADLSEAAVEDLVIQISQAEDARGNKISLMPKRLIVSPAQQFEAARILKSSLQNDTANNAINALREMGVFTDGMHVNHYLTSDDAWFIKTNAVDGVKRLNRVKPSFGEDNDFLTGNGRFKVRARWSDGWTDPRGMYGSAGTA